MALGQGRQRHLARRRSLRRGERSVIFAQKTPKMDENSKLEGDCSVIGTLQLEVTHEDWDPLQYARLGRQTALSLKPNAITTATPTPPATGGDKKFGTWHRSSQRRRLKGAKRRHVEAKQSQAPEVDRTQSQVARKRRLGWRQKQSPEPATVVKQEEGEKEPQSIPEVTQLRGGDKQMNLNSRPEVLSGQEQMVKLKPSASASLDMQQFAHAFLRRRGRQQGGALGPTFDPPSSPGHFDVLLAKRTYARRRHTPKLVPPQCGTFAEPGLGRPGLGPTLEASEQQLNCLAFCFPAPNTFDFEAEQALVQLTLNAETAKEQAQQRTKYRRAYRYRLMHPTPDATQCEHCGTFYNTKPNFHLYSCPALHKKVPCPDCGRVFATSRTLRSHQVIHTRSIMKTHPCLLCGKFYASKKGVSRHMSDMHQDMMKHSHQCTVCHRRFSEESGLLKHLKVHEGREPLCCPGCDKHFTYPSNMKYHKCHGRPS